jgi:sugar/nucleoside kinase (ribokinase family)
MGFDIVCVGLACADVMVRPVETFPDRGKLALVPTLEIHLGGLAGVAAAVYSRLGGSSAFIGKLGTDGFGDYCRAALEQAGVNVDGLVRTSHEGTPATVVLISEDGERTFMHHPGCSRTFSESDIDFGFIRHAQHLHWGGPAVTPGLDGEPMGRVLQRARELGLTTSMDTCYDGLGKWFSRIERALPHLNIVMSSLEEARCYTGKESPGAIADFYRSFGPDTALVKLGDGGLFVKNEIESHHLPAHRVDVVDTTGAGDAACGAYLYGYIRGWDALRCARLANAVGALTVQTMGGSEGARPVDQVLEFMEQTPAFSETH